MNSSSETSTLQPLKTRWILDKRLDAAFFVGTPLLILPIFFAANTRWSSADLFLIVSTFGALGHHAPGLMRAYGDKQLFRRFWIRFTLVPIVAITVFSLYTMDELPGIMLVLLTWGFWHFLMQTYGFARIYDAKVGSFDASTQWLDFGVCVAWSGSCILFAPSRMYELLTLALKSGLTPILDLPLDSLRTFWLGGTIFVTILFASNILWKAARGESVNIAKLILFGATFSFFWFCSVTLTSLLLGVAMFEIFHDVQYLAIVWLFNRNQVKKKADVGPFTKFLFRPSSGLVGLYLGLIFAYGFMGFAAERLTSGRLQQVLFSIVAASNLVHFYYDGFIWKIREAETGKALGVETGLARVRMPRWFNHASKWAVLLAIIGVLLLTERSSTMTEPERNQAIAERVPKSVSAQNALAKTLLDQREYLEVIRICRAAQKMNDDQYRTHMYLGVALTATGKPNLGFNELQQAFELNPRDAYLQFHLAMGCIRRNEYDQALVHLEESVALSPEDAVGEYNLGVLYLLMERLDESIASLDRAVQLTPEYPAAYLSLGEAHLKNGTLKSAIRSLETCLLQDPGRIEAYGLLSQSLRQQGHIAEANEALQAGIEVQMNSINPPDGINKAVVLATELLENTPSPNLETLDLVARCYALAGKHENAIKAATKGVELAKKQADIQLIESLEVLIKKSRQQIESTTTP